MTGTGRRGVDAGGEPADTRHNVWQTICAFPWRGQTLLLIWQKIGQRGPTITMNFSGPRESSKQLPPVGFAALWTYARERPLRLGVTCAVILTAMLLVQLL